MTSFHNPAGAPSWDKNKLKVIGSGSYGWVYSTMDLVSGKSIAVKEADIRELDGVKALQKRYHKNIVRYLGAETKEETSYILLEYVPGGSVSSHLESGPFPEAKIRIYVEQLLSGLRYLHRKGITHGDIKGANILVHTDGCAKLADFGLSRQGAQLWMAPEVLLNKDIVDSRFADIWSVGCTVIEMATGKDPWRGKYKTLASFLEHMEKADSVPPLDDLSSDVKRFLRRCLQRESSSRASASELLQDPFIMNQNFTQSVAPSRPVVQPFAPPCPVVQPLAPPIEYGYLPYLFFETHAARPVAPPGPVAPAWADRIHLQPLPPPPVTQAPVFFDYGVHSGSHLNSSSHGTSANSLFYVTSLCDSLSHKGSSTRFSENSSHQYNASQWSSSTRLSQSSSHQYNAPQWSSSTRLSESSSHQYNAYNASPWISSKRSINGSLQDTAYQLSACTSWSDSKASPLSFSTRWSDRLRQDNASQLRSSTRSIDRLRQDNASQLRSSTRSIDSSRQELAYLSSGMCLSDNLRQSNAFHSDSRTRSIDVSRQRSNASQLSSSTHLSDSNSRKGNASKSSSRTGSSSSSRLSSTSRMSSLSVLSSSSRTGSSSSSRLSSTTLSSTSRMSSLSVLSSTSRFGASTSSSSRR